MINKALVYIKEYLSERMKTINPPGENWAVELSALSKEGQPAGLDILITLVHIEEERSQKSQEYYHKTNTGTTFVIPEIILNLYILITSQKEPYETALKQISQVIGIFQVKNAFKKDEIGKKGLKSLSFDLYPLSLEQSNNLWQTLGATVMPSVMYKVRSIVIQDDSDVLQGPLVGDGLVVHEVSDKEEGYIPPSTGVVINVNNDRKIEKK